MYLWGSNILRAFADDHPLINAYLDRIPVAEIALPSPVVAEALRGRCDYALKATPAQAQSAHALLLETLEMLESFQIIAFDQASTECFRQLKNKHPQHKRHPDLMIAAIAVAGRHIVVTRNYKDFAKFLPLQQLQNWIDDPPTN